MSQQTLQQLLGDILKNHGEAYENAKEGKSPNSVWDAAGKLPMDIEYRLRVDTAVYTPSKASGKPQIVLTYEVVEPADYAGAKFQDYVNPNPTNTMGTEILAKLFGALQADMTNFSDFGDFVTQFEDRTVVAALRKWGEENDRVGVRYVNMDRGQELRKVNPPKMKGAPPALRPDINIPKDEPFPESGPAVTPPPISIPGAAPTQAPSSAPVVNLPPGLR